MDKLEIELEPAVHDALARLSWARFGGPVRSRCPWLRRL